FFSNTRRHTRGSGDWSSDVCSSDLTILRPRLELRVSRLFFDLRFVAAKVAADLRRSTQTKARRNDGYSRKVARASGLRNDRPAKIGRAACRARVTIMAVHVDR